jgi:hypothetical protein
MIKGHLGVVSLACNIFLASEVGAQALGIPQQLELVRRNLVEVQETVSQIAANTFAIDQTNSRSTPSVRVSFGDTVFCSVANLASEAQTIETLLIGSGPDGQPFELGRSLRTFRALEAQEIRRDQQPLIPWANVWCRFGITSGGLRTSIRGSITAFVRASITVSTSPDTDPVSLENLVGYSLPAE